MTRKQFINPNKLPIDFLPNLGLEVYQVVNSSDVGAILQMEVDNYEEQSGTPLDHSADWYGVQDILDAIDREDHIVVLRETETKKWVGMIWGEVQDNKCLHVHTIVTAVAWRGKRLATWMIDEQVRYAASLGLNSIGGDVDPLNRVGLGVYFKKGCVITGYKPGPDQQWDLNEWVEMSRPITDRTLELGEDIIEVLTGDEKGLQRAIEEGRIGYELTPDPDGDPYNGVIKFGIPLYGYDEIWDSV